jgi:hypothetical protein
MTIDEAIEYVDRAHEAEGEQRAEFGMGAVSMGFDPYDAMTFYNGYRIADDPDYAAARRIIDAYSAERALVQVVRWAPFNPDDIPF